MLPVSYRLHVLPGWYACKAALCNHLDDLNAISDNGVENMLIWILPGIDV